MKAQAVAVAEDFADVQLGGARMLGMVMLGTAMFYVTVATLILI